MGTKTTGTRWATRRSPLCDEGGMLLVITMVILLVVSTLAATNLINAFLERSIAKNQNDASVALNAADGGINDALTWLNNDANLPTIPTAVAPWTRPGDPTTRTLVTDPTADARDAAVRYTVNLGFKLDAEDVDCDGSTTDVVVFNRGGMAVACPHDGLFNYPGAIFTGAAGDVGYPVITIKAKGYIGSESNPRSYREIDMDVARNKLQVQVEGAFTARAGVDATGAATTDGRNYDLSGNLVGGGVGCMSDKPGITYDNGIVPSETCPNANIVGTPCVANHDPTAPGKRPLEKTPWGVLGLSLADFNAMFTKKTASQVDMTGCYPEKHYVWFSSVGGAAFNNASPCNNYSGIIVIHNENFDPDQWEALCFAGSTNAYCTADANADGQADNAPATFDMNGNVQWTGVVIADQVVRVNGSPTILGGIISLASGGVIDSSITGDIDILYSCEAVTGATNQGYKTRLGWHRVR